MVRFPTDRSRLAVLSVLATAVVAFSAARPAAAQGYGGPMNGSASQARSGAEQRAFDRRSDDAVGQKRTLYGGAALTDDNLVSVEFVGNNTIPAHAIASLIGSQAGRPAYEAQVSADVRALYETRWFRSVEPLIEQSADGPSLVFRVKEQPIVGNIEFRGNKKIKDKKLLAECGLTPFRSPYDPIANRKCADRIQRLYRDKGYREVAVQIVSGTEAHERDVIFDIAEGPKIAVDGFDFVGNRDISSAVLQTKLATKRRWFRVIGGKYDPETLADDEAALTQYYQNLGYFDATVKAAALQKPGTGSLTIRYEINEGALYSVDSIRFEGNAILADGELRSKLELTEGKRFLARELRKDLESLKDSYDDLYRPFAQVNFEREFSSEPGKVGLVYRINEDRPYVIGRVNVTIRGDDPHTKETLVLNQVSRHFVPGQPARAKDIRLATERLRGGQIWERADPPAINIRPVDGDAYLSSPIARGQSRFPQASEQAPPRHTPAAGLPTGHSVMLPSRRSLAAPTQNTTHTTAFGPEFDYIDEELEYSTEGFYEWMRQPEGPSFNLLDGGATAPIAEPVDEDEIVVGRPVIRGQSFDPGFPADTFRSQSIDRRGQPVPQSFLPGGSPQGDPFGGTLGGQPPGFVDIDIDVTEARTGRFMFGAGVNSDAGVVGQIVLEENNFDLFNPPRSFADFRNGRAWRGAGQSFRLEAAPGDEVSRYLVNWTNPYFLNTDYSLGVSGFYYTRFFEDWTEERTGGRVSIGRTLNQFWSASLALRMERVLVRDVIDNAANNAPQVLANAVGSNFLSTARVSIAYDTRDSAFNPSKGLLAEYSFEQAFGEFNYPRAEINASQFWTIFERPDGYGKQTLRLSGRAGFLGADAPIFEHFYAGGFQSLRGFDFRGVSPQASGPAPSTPRRVGGDFLFTGTLEYMFPITANDNFKGVVFTDFGTVSEDVSFDQFRASAGFGLRVNVPAMGPAPLAFDFAFPLASEAFDDERVFSFYVGLTR